ncbi:MAG: aminotransferase class I/II-fold pyridoxal phosphate-dependent enzyme [Armatimonadia bacterium]|nr:aminotransferase class I/II-fold pyridoxal phosphate-dependent enzyme [Armatimonadia bacterium]
MRLATRATQVTPSATIGLTQKAAALKAEGVDLIAFTAGEPDFDTPDAIKSAAVEAIKAGDTKYVPKGGAELKKTIAEWTNKQRGTSYEAGQVLVSCGAKHSISNAALALLEEGDEVILPAPYWLTYPETVKLAGAVPVAVDASPSQGFVPDPDDIRKAITPKTRMIVLNSPSNPTGAVYPAEVIKAIADIARESDLWVMADEIYDKLVYEGSEFVSILDAGEDMAERTLLINGASKTYAMTGWRIGWTLGPTPVIKAMTAIQSHLTSNPTSFCQTATLASFENVAAEVEEMRQAFERRRGVMMEAMKALDKAVTPLPGGAFYVFPDVSAYIANKGFSGSVEMAEWLLENAKVVVVPGEPFGNDACIRLSFAVSDENIERGVERLAQALA